MPRPASPAGIVCRTYKKKLVVNKKEGGRKYMHTIWIMTCGGRNQNTYKFV